MLTTEGALFSVMELGQEKVLVIVHTTLFAFWKGAQLCAGPDCVIGTLVFLKIIGTH
jgi:hypothetical protein